jgi:hypothetical protein
VAGRISAWEAVSCVSRSGTLTSKAAVIRRLGGWSCVPDPRGGELDCQRQAIEFAADVGHHSGGARPSTRSGLTASARSQIRDVVPAAAVVGWLVF